MPTAFDSDLSVFKLKGVLPEGHSFPYGFGFMPATKAADGDPLNVLLLDAPTVTGYVVEARLTGTLEVAANSREHKSIHALADLSSDMLHEIEHFFIFYNKAKGKARRVLRRVGPARAHALLQQALP